jgi:hypothetical protein
MSSVAEFVDADHACIGETVLGGQSRYDAIHDAANRVVATGRRGIRFHRDHRRNGPLAKNVTGYAVLSDDSVRA